LLALYGDAFDLVIVQVYEGWSRAGHAILAGEEDPTRYLVAMAQSYIHGWAVDFAGAFGLGNNRTVRVPASKLVLGLANGWARAPKLAPKFLYIDGDDAGDAIDQLRTAGSRWPWAPVNLFVFVPPYHAQPLDTRACCCLRRTSPVAVLLGFVADRLSRAWWCFAAVSGG
jgi:hypothetical protein